MIATARTISRTTANANVEPTLSRLRSRLRAGSTCHIRPNGEEDFFIGTADNYIALWQSVSAAFFAVFVMVSSISWDGGRAFG